jgi:hypothetical protein
MNLPLPSATVSEINFSHTKTIMRNFVAHINKDESENEELAVLSALPLFASIINQLQVWNGDVRLLPDADKLIESISTFTNYLECKMGQRYEH